MTQIGAKHHRWNDKNPSYATVHEWLKNNFKKDWCEHCGTTKNLEFALKKGETHSHSREKYLLLCRPCHNKYDREEKSQKISRTKRMEKYKILLSSGSLSKPETERIKKLIETI